MVMNSVDYVFTDELVQWVCLSKQTNASPCLAALRSPGVIYSDGGWAKGFLQCLLCSGVGTAQHGQFTQAPDASLCIC